MPRGGVPGGGFLLARGRVPVIAGVGFGQRLAVDLARASAQAGADGILAFPPYYPQADDEGMLAYYRAIGEATPLGLLIYSRDWANFGPASIRVPLANGTRNGCCNS